jgi:Pretoxin HINT domain
MKNSLFILFLAICSTFQAVGQTGCYVQLQDGSGINNAAMQVKLDSAAIRIRQILPTASQAGFHFYQAGFYIQQENYKKWQYPELFDTLVKRVALTSSAHILIGWQNDTRGLNTQFSVDVYLPNFGSCSVDVSDLAKVFLETHLEKAYNQNSRAPGLAYAAVVRCLDDLAIYLQDIKTCCQQGGNDVASCVTCVRPDNQKNFLYAQGFTAIPIKNIGIDPQPFVRPEIINRANLLFTIDDLTAVDLGDKYKTVIDTFLADTLSICVIITKDENLCTPVWDSLTTIATSGQFDIVYWHHIHKGKGLGDAFLFTNAYFDGKGNQRFDGRGNDRFITNIMASLGSAATDFMFQVGAHYLMDEDVDFGIDGLKQAVAKVDYKDVAKSALFGLFGVSEKIQVVASALADATAYTIKLCNWYEVHPPNPTQYPEGYTYSWIAKDFGTEFLKDLVSEGLQQVLGNSAGKVLGKVKKIPLPGWCKIARMLNAKLGTLLPGCFVAGTLVMTPEGLVSIEKLQTGDWVLGDLAINPYQFAKLEQESTEQKQNDSDYWASSEVPTAADFVKKSTPQERKYIDIPLEPAYHLMDITPETWSELKLEVKKIDGSTADVLLLRPNDWVDAKALCVAGDSTWFDFPEMKVNGMALVRSIQPAKLDTRSAKARDLLAHGYFPILAAFKHKSNEVVHLHFTNGDKIATTAPHPFWSNDRNGWLAAEFLEQGERIKTADGETRIDTSWSEFGQTTVYNLEVKEARNYFVGENAEIVHNNCGFDVFECLSYSKIRQKKFIKEIWELGFPEFFQRGSFFERLIQVKKLVGFNHTGDVMSNFPVLDSFKPKTAWSFVDNGVAEVVQCTEAVSIKSTKVLDVDAWKATYKSHLDDLRDKIGANGSGFKGKNKTIKYDSAKVLIAVEEKSLAKYKDWITTLKAAYPNLNFEIITAESLL